MWLTLIIVGVVLAILGVAIEAARFLIWLGVILAGISVIMSIVRRGASGVCAYPPRRVRTPRCSRGPAPSDRLPLRWGPVLCARSAQERPAEQPAIAARERFE